LRNEIPRVSGSGFELSVLFEEVCNEAKELACFDIWFGRFPKEDRAGELWVRLQGNFQPLDFRAFWSALANGVQCVGVHDYRVDMVAKIAIVLGGRLNIIFE
jgi:hypothetical protein